MTLIFCEKPILPWHKYCTHCGLIQHDERDFAESRRFTIERYKRLSKEFDFSKENIAKIEKVNDALFAKMERLFAMTLEIRNLFLRLQENGREDFYEFVIRGNVSVCESCIKKTTPVADAETAKKIWCSANLTEVIPNCKFEIDYNFGWPDEYPSKKEWLSEVPHTGVFAAAAFDKMKICRATDILFNKQKAYTLQDALYMTAADFEVEFRIFVAKRLWRPDKKLWKGRFFGIHCLWCKRLVLPFDKYCPKCGGGFHDRTLKGTWAEKTVQNKHRWKKRSRNFDWNYDNKMKVYEITDRTTQLLYHLYDEGFALQKVFNEERAKGDSLFRHFDFNINGTLKYLNKEATPPLENEELENE